MPDPIAPHLSIVCLLFTAGCSGATAGMDLAVPADLSTSLDRWGTPPPDLTMPAGPPDFAGPTANVLQHHLNASRDGRYIDPAFTKAAAGALHRDLSFTATMSGPTYAQPLYFETGPGGKSLVIATTEQNTVYAFDAAGGAVVWQKKLGAPVPLQSLPCGNIDPLGITGTPVIDESTRRIFVAAMTTPDGGATKKHLLFALSLDTGNVENGWPVDVGASATFGNLKFNSAVQNQRGALLLQNGTLYVPYGGHYGDCGIFHGWVVGVSIDNPAAVTAWATRAQGGGSWAPGGIAGDGTNLFLATGNTFGTNTWMDGEAVIRLQPGPVYSQQPTDYYAPANWQALDNADEDIGGSGALLVDVAGATPGRLVVALGKNGIAYLLDRSNLGGIGKQIAAKTVASAQIITAPVAYTTSMGTYVVFHGPGTSCPNGPGDLVALRIAPGTPPTLSIAWCANENGSGSPMVTTSDGTHDAVVWGLGAEGDQRLHGLDGDTGQVVYGGGGNMDLMAGLRRFNPAIAAKGRIFIAGDSQVYAFTP